MDIILSKLGETGVAIIFLIPTIRTFAEILAIVMVKGGSMELIIKEYGGIIILLVCLSLAMTFISMCIAKCAGIEDTLLNVLFCH